MSNGGMRRILKHPPSAVAWIRNKYNKGLYDKNDSSIPIAHEIFSLNPPLSSPVTFSPRIHKEDEEHRKIHLPTERAIRSYVQRHDLKKQAAQESGQKGPEDKALMEEERMAKLLGVDRKSGLGNKSIVYNNAYKFAIRQLEVQRDNPKYSEEEAVQAVEDILKIEDKKERITSREITKVVTSEAKDLKKNINHDAYDTSTSAGETKTKTPQFDTDTIPSILHGDSQTILQLTIWGERLQQVPYDRWTLGAATALDHWIATKILKLKEETWEEILKGTERIGLSRGRDIIAVRKALFPETSLEFSEEDAFLEEANEEDTEKRIDDLLASLQFDENEDEEGETDDKWGGDDFGDFIGEEEKFQSRLEDMLETLQSWRERHAQTSYDEWDNVAKMEFDKFLNEYVNHLTPETEMHLIDLDSTRKSLLSQPPMKREASDSFFSKLVDETEAEIFLDQLHSPSAGTSNNSNPVLQQFLTLPYSEQLSRLVAIGTLRPLYDEYTTEKARLNFLKDNEAFLLRGVPLESLVEDEKGPVLLHPSVMTADVNTKDGVSKHESREKMTRFRIDKVPFGTENLAREEAIFEAWSAYKSAKATHEENLFNEGKLGLDYEEEGEKCKKDDKE